MAPFIEIDAAQTQVAEIAGAANHLVDSGQRTVHRAAARGQQLVDSGQQRVQDAWEWLTD